MQKKVETRATWGTLSRLVAAASLIWIPLSMGASAQEPSQEPDRPVAAPVVPQQVRYAGKLAMRVGQTIQAEFRIYAAQEGGEPLWSETQQFPVAADGSYSILLGSASQAGLPQSVFAGGAARWLAVSIERAPEQERVLLSSVPYAMKSADAESLSGHAASDFVTQEQLAALAAVVPTGQPTQPVGAPGTEFQPLTSGPISGSGTIGNLAVFTGANTIGNSDIVQVGSKIGLNVASPAALLDVGGTATVRGTLDLPALNTATTTSGYNSNSLELGSSAWSTTAAGPVAQNFFLENLATGNNTASPAAKIDLLFASGTGNPAATGLSFSSNGLINFAAGQTFPGASTITTISTASPLTGGGSTGPVTLALSLPTLEASLDAVYPQLAIGNNFHASQTITGSLTTTVAVNTAALNSTTASIEGLTTAIGGINVGNSVQMHQINLATPTTPYNSPFFQFIGSAYNSTLAAAENETFAWQTIVTGNNTASPSAHLQLLSGSGATQTPTGLTIAKNGNITFAPSQTFPGGPGSGTISGITTSSPLTGSGTTGSVALALNENTLTSDITPTLETTFNSIYPQLTFSNTFTTGQIIEGASVISGTNISGPMLQVTNSGDSFSSGISVSNGGQYGIGLVASSSSDGDGIEGFGTQTAGSIGVLGALSNSNGFSNSFFLLESDDGLDSGIWADGANGQEAALIATADDLSAGIFFNDSSASSTIVVLNNFSGGPTGNIASGIGTVLRAGGPGGTCGINQTGNLSCTGQVKTLVSTKDGARQLETYSVQSSENWVEDYGSGQLQNGSASIQIEPAFAQTVNTGVEFHVFLTPGGDCKGLYVTNKTAGSFEVHELGGGASTIPFDYKIVAKRNGLETQRLSDVTERMHSESEAARLKTLDHPLPHNRLIQPHPRTTAAVTKKQ